MRTLRYAFEALFLHLLFFIFRLLPVKTASDLGGAIGKTVGPRLAASRKAERNLSNALPALSAAERKNTIRNMWENLGRIIAEYPHLETIAVQHTKIEGAGILDNILKKDSPSIFFGGHLANWEVNCATLYKRFNHPIDLTYRAPNNPWSDALLLKARTLNGRLQAFSKSRKGGKDLMRALKKGHAVGILIDQKYNEGVAAPFFGMPAMTNPAFVQLCQKYKCPLVPVQNERINGTCFKLTVYEPISLFEEDGTTPRSVEDVIKDAHRHLERWITQNPGQWLWLHRRWDSMALKAGEDTAVSNNDTSDTDMKQSSGKFTKV